MEREELLARRRAPQLAPVDEPHERGEGEAAAPEGRGGRRLGHWAAWIHLTHESVTRVRPLLRTEWRRGTYAYGTRVDTWPAVYERERENSYARLQPRGEKKDQPGSSLEVVSK